MKDRSGSMGGFLVTVLTLLIGALLVYGNLFDREVGAIISDQLDRPVVGAILGMILILSVILKWVDGLTKSKDAFINFHSDDGSVGISTKAICDFIERIGREFTAIQSIDSKLTGSKGAVDILLSVKVLSGNKIPELSHVLQQRVRESVRESLGLEEIRNITIKVQEIVGEPAKPAAKPASEK